MAQAFGGQLGILAEGNLPGDLALVQVDGVERSPRRLDGRIAIRIEELVIAVVPVPLFDRPGTARDGGYGQVFARGQVRDDGG